jgi:hypothetical protein
MHELIELVARVEARHAPVIPCGLCKGRGWIKSGITGKRVHCLACGDTGVQQWAYQRA